MQLVSTKPGQNILYYVHDPMCSWCYGFRPVLDRMAKQLPESVALVYVLGGLAPDTDEPMPDEIREYVINTWRRIEKVIPGIYFNFQFWDTCSPRRSTYPACRAVIAARQQRQGADVEMIRAIQDAYYREARDPSDINTLAQLAGEIGLDTGRFTRDLAAEQIDNCLQEEIRFARELNVDSFPSLVLEVQGSRRSIPVDYHAQQSMLEMITKCLQQNE